MGCWACAQSKSLIPASGSRSALSTGSPLSHIHTELCESLSITPPLLHLFPSDLTIVPQALTAFSVWHPWLSQQALWLAETVRKCSQTKTHTFIWRCGTINRRDAASRDQILSTETSTAHRSSHGTYNHCSNDQFSGAADSEPQGKLKLQEDWNAVNDTLSLFTLTLYSRISCWLTLFSSVQLRKPLVEKLRRERINSSIEQLKSLLGPQFLKQQPDSKLEKADILEMTVCVLRRLQQQQQCPAVDSAAVDQGYSRCVQEVEHFLSGQQVETQSQRRLLKHFNKLQSSYEKNLREADFSPLSSTVHTSISKDKSPVNSALWRPW